MSVLVWIMIGIAVWHFAVLVPDRFVGGIIGALLAAVGGGLLSGYLLPLPLLPRFIARAAEWLPFRFMLSVPVELMTRPLAARDVAMLLAGQTAWAAACVAAAMLIGRRGIQRFESVGG